MLQLHRLQSFVAVVEAGSFTAAAATLGLSKAVVSLHVKQLEAELGSTLLTRTTRRVVPTDAGERFHRASQRLLRDAEGAVAEARGAHDGLTGTLRITSIAEYLAVVLVPAVAAFSARHPRLLIEASGSPGHSDLVRERFDLAIRLGRLRDSSLQATRLARFRVHAVATPELLAARGLPRDPGELSRLPWVGFDVTVARPSPVRPYVWTDRAGAESEAILAPLIRSDSVIAVHGLIRAHAGAGILPDWLTREDIAAGRLVELIPGHELPAQGIFAVRPRSGHVPAKVRAFIDFLRAFVNAEATIPRPPPA